MKPELVLYFSRRAENGARVIEVGISDRNRPDSTQQIALVLVVCQKSVEGDVELLFGSRRLLT